MNSLSYDVIDEQAYRVILILSALNAVIFTLLTLHLYEKCLTFHSNSYIFLKKREIIYNTLHIRIISIIIL